MSGTVDLDVRDGIATITFDNREKRNALGPPLIAKIIDILEEIEERDDVRCVVLTGAGEKAFSSGFDISFHQRNYGEGPEKAEDVEEGDFSEMADLVKYFDYPTIAMINGGTFGGAMHLIASCDLRIAVEDAQFGITPARLGLVYDGEAIGEVMTHVGASNVKEFLFTADFVDAERASEMGLVNYVVERDELEEKTYDMAESIANNAPMSLKYMKRIVRALIDHGKLTDAEEAWAHELREEAKRSADHQEGVEAFMENREPEFQGH
jgi:methylmalonyl-CoA decarboxylase